MKLPRDSQVLRNRLKQAIWDANHNRERELDAIFDTIEAYMTEAAIPSPETGGAATPSIARTFKLARVEHEGDAGGFEVTTLRLNTLDDKPDAMLSLMGRPWLQELPAGSYVSISVEVSMHPPVVPAAEPGKPATWASTALGTPVTAGEGKPATHFRWTGQVLCADLTGEPRGPVAVKQEDVTCAKCIGLLR